VYDALVGAAAAEHGSILATRDQRALDTYRTLDVRVELWPESLRGLFVPAMSEGRSYEVTEANEDPAAFLTTSRYPVVAARG
jgi:hypothetical protein